jgi:CRP-like cAMP-binding protein
MRTAQALRHVSLFADLDDAEIEVVASASRTRTYAKGHVLFQEGDPGDYLVAILKGRLKVSLLGADGQEAIIATLEPPAVLGEVALLDDAPRSATVTAVEPAEVIQIPRAPFVAVIKRHPAIAFKIMVQMTAALRRATEQVRTLSMFDVHGRVLRCLLGMAQERGETSRTRMIIRPKPSITEIANRIGCKRETVSRALKVLRTTGYVTSVERGYAVEQRAIRQYLQPTLETLKPIADPTRHGWD